MYWQTVQSILRQIIDKNDQQASIFLQQKLKNCQDPISRSQLINGIVPRTLDLVTNRSVWFVRVRSATLLMISVWRFGNFRKYHAAARCSLRD